MFDIGFGELLIIAILGLLVLGPERLPVAVKTIGLWLGRFKRSYRNIRSEIEQEIGADEIRRQLHNEEIMQSLEKSKQQLDELARGAEDNLEDVKNQVLSEPDTGNTPKDHKSQVKNSLDDRT